jgi:hypothetical protein
MFRCHSAQACCYHSHGILPDFPPAAVRLSLPLLLLLVVLGLTLQHLRGDVNLAWPSAESAAAAAACLSWLDIVAPAR